MLTAAKNQIKVNLLTIKYALMREMLNKVTFISNVIFMVLNNASVFVQWIIIFGIKDNIGTYGMKEVILLWAFASGTYGVAHFFFKNAFYLTDIINTGKLDTVLVQPKNVLLSVITTDISPSAIGDLIYGYVLLIIYGITPLNFLLFTLFIITGGIIMTASVIILGSLSFWFGKTDILVETVNTLFTCVSTYPESIFKTAIKIFLYTVVPVGLVSYLPISVITLFNLKSFIIILVYTIVIIALTFFVFNLGLKKYSSTNLMNARN